MFAAAGGFALPFALGYITAAMFGATLYQSLFIGMGVSVSAIAVEAVILHSLRIHNTNIGHIIIGAAIADDIMALISLTVLLSLAKTGSIDVAAVSITVVKVSAFFLAAILLGHLVMPRVAATLSDHEGKTFTFAMVAALVFAYLADLAGLHHIIGAFFAGLYVRKEVKREDILRTIRDRFFGISYGFLVPIFFASLSFNLHINSEASFFIFSAIIILAAIAGKLVGCGLGYYLVKRNYYESVIVGFGMNGRGAIELVVASVVINLSDRLLRAGTIDSPLLTEMQFAALILMAFVTTLLAPLTLKWSVKRACAWDDSASYCIPWQKEQ